MKRIGLVAVVLLTACVTSPGTGDDGNAGADDAEAEAAAATSPGTPDVASPFLGLYASHATHHYDTDVPALELRSDGQYVRERCYHASCAIKAPETDRFDTYKSSAGKTYVRFYSWTPGRDADGNLVENPTIADVYEIRTTSHGVDVRKAYSSRWQSLYTTTPAKTCTTSGGTFAADACTCPGTDSFAPGAGGCITLVPESEDQCDSSKGQWLDDDANLVGAYCVCGANRYVDATGACASTL